MNVEEIAVLEMDFMVCFSEKQKGKFFGAVCRSFEKCVNPEKIDRDAPFG